MIKLNKDKAIHVVRGSFNQMLESGLIKREYFSGLAMQSLIQYHIERGRGWLDISIHDLAKKSIMCAEALLEKLEEDQNK